MKTTKRRPQTGRTVQRIAKKVLRKAETKAQKLFQGVEKKLDTPTRKTRGTKQPRKKMAAARPRKRTTSRSRARA
ncbi:MAG TPA: hypothetical protein VGH28_15285 [Polyangiaceae bacterium]|jgi:hypothetical protein